MKKIVFIALTALLLLAAVACGQKDEPSQIANPWLDHKTLEDACTAVGFDFTVPDKIDGYDAPIYRTLDNEIIEVIYSAKDDEICIRKYAGTEDRSQDFGGIEAYPHGGYATEVDNCYREMGSDFDIINLVSWGKDNYSFIFFSSNGFSDANALFDIIHQIR